MTWLSNGQEHRLDGPAVVFEDGTVEYWVSGLRMSEKVWREHQERT
jgi:hypothetical protein